MQVTENINTRVIKFNKNKDIRWYNHNVRAIQKTSLMKTKNNV